MYSSGNSRERKIRINHDGALCASRIAPNNRTERIRSRYASFDSVNKRMGRSATEVACGNLRNPYSILKDVVAIKIQAMRAGSFPQNFRTKTYTNSTLAA
jgi:hypothetical protein